MCKIWTFIGARSPSSATDLFRAAWFLGAENITIFTHDGAVREEEGGFLWLREAMEPIDPRFWSITQVLVQPVETLGQFMLELVHLDRTLLTKGIAGMPAHRTSLLKRVYLPFGEASTEAIALRPLALGLPFPAAGGPPQQVPPPRFEPRPEEPLPPAAPLPPSLTGFEEDFSDPGPGNVFIPEQADLDRAEALRKADVGEQVKAALASRKPLVKQVPPEEDFPELTSDERKFAEILLSGITLKPAANMMGISWQYANGKLMQPIIRAFKKKGMDFRAMIQSAADDRAGGEPQPATATLS